RAIRPLKHQRPGLCDLKADLQGAGTGKALTIRFRCETLQRVVELVSLGARLERIDACGLGTTSRPDLAMQAQYGCTQQPARFRRFGTVIRERTVKDQDVRRQLLECIALRVI